MIEQTTIRRRGRLAVLINYTAVAVAATFCFSIFLADGCAPVVNVLSDVDDPDSGDSMTEGDSTGADPDILPVTQGDWYRPTVETTWQWQLQPGDAGEINTSYDVDVYDVDLFDVPDSLIQSLQDAGRKVICYFSAGSFEDFRSDAGEFDDADLGQTLDGFSDERWLDVRSANVRDIMLGRLDLAKSRGCDGVEPDNVDGFDNETGFDLTALDQLAFNRFLANEAHLRGLSVGLKNDLDQLEALVDYFDFSVNEQCHEFDECDLLLAFVEAGKPVFNAEYDDAFVNNTDERASLCDAANGLNIRTLVLPLDLDDSFRISCEANLESARTEVRGWLPQK